jgi:hypothetical protein
VIYKRANTGATNNVDFIGECVEKPHNVALIGEYIIITGKQPF